jgi:hypothetical protein
MNAYDLLASQFCVLESPKSGPETQSSHLLAKGTKPLAEVMVIVGMDTSRV